MNGLPESIVVKIDRPPVEEGCWHWTGGRTSHGYGTLWFDGRSQRAHRVVYEALVGPIPDGLVIDHLCRNRLCVNPDHLEPVTLLENIRRGQGNGSKTHCPSGHEYTPENTRRNALGWRYCRTCKRIDGH